MAEFEDDLTKLTITQGRLLIKLIDRETGNTSFDLVKELRGSFSAFFWQAIARLFGSNLKSTFDKDGEDKLIDQILVLIDNGQL
jgi:pyruvate dehydrogenase complex dehydrogenase (E1) component